MNKSDVLVIVPALNEAKHLPEVLKGIFRFLPQCNVLVVDDGSEDESSTVSRQNGALVIRHSFQLGYGVALQTGYKFAARNGYAIVLQIDGDGQHDPEGLLQILSVLQRKEADIVLGTRFHKNSTYAMPVFRRLGNRFFNQVVQFFTGYQITDSTSGFQGFNREVLHLFISDLYPWDYPDANALLMLHYANFRLVEVPVTMRLDKDGKSMHQGLLKPLYYLLIMVLSVLVTILRGRRYSRDELRNDALSFKG